MREKVPALIKKPCPGNDLVLAAAAAQDVAQTRRKTLEKGGTKLKHRETFDNSERLDNSTWFLRVKIDGC